MDLPKTCSACTTTLPPEANFCFECGHRWEPKRCKACATKLPEGSKFCFECGLSTTVAARRCGQRIDDHSVCDSSDGDDGIEVDADAPPSRFRPGILGRATSHNSNAVEVHSPKHATECLRGKVGMVPSTFSRNKTIFSCVPAAA